VRDNGESTFRISSKNSADIPNRFSLEFQDEMNDYQQDSLSLVDVEDSRRTGVECCATLTALGVPNFDQASRLLRLALDKSIRGNQFIEFDTTVRGVLLRPGDLITVTYQRHGLERQLFRIIRISPSLNYRRVQVTAQHHSDDWYTGATGLSGSQSGRQPDLGGETPHPVAGTEVGELGMAYGMSESSGTASDGSAWVKLHISFLAPKAPSPLFTRVPTIGLSPRLLFDEGTLPGGTTYYYAISAVDDIGRESDLSFFVRADMLSAGSTNTVALKDMTFPQTATSFNVYRGTTPLTLNRIASSLPISASFSDAGLTETGQSPPDKNFDHANAYWRLEVMSPVRAQSQAAQSIGNSTLGMQLNEHAGRVVRILAGHGAGQERQISGNSATELFVDRSWDELPNATSVFSIAEAAWHFGATTKTSSVDIDIPNRAAACVQVQVRAANAAGQECSSETSTISRWRILGSPGGNGHEYQLPPAPSFALSTTGRGVLDVSAIGFADPTATRTVTAATLTTWYWSTLSGRPSVVLAESLSSYATSLVSSEPLPEGSLLQIDEELLTASESGDSETIAVRAVRGTGAATHAAGTPIYVLSDRSWVLGFPKDFFGSPASGSYSYSVDFPHARISAADMFVTNSLGNSVMTTNAFTHLGNGGLFTYSGGQYSLQVQGAMAIQSDAVPPLIVDSARCIRDAFAVLGRRPTGGTVRLAVKQNGSLLCSLEIAPGNSRSETCDGFQLEPLVAGAALSLDIVSVPQSPDTEPGRDLTVTIRF
jgi:hypothetical protein